MVIVKACSPSRAEICCVNFHDPFLENMERVLCVWLEDEAQGLTVDDVVMQKAVDLYNHYAESGGDRNAASMPVKVD